MLTKYKIFVNFPLKIGFCINRRKWAKFYGGFEKDSRGTEQKCFLPGRDYREDDRKCRSLSLCAFHVHFSFMEKGDVFYYG